MTTQQPEALPALIERLRLLPIDHAPDGWPAVRTREITALLDRITELEAQLAAIGAGGVEPLRKCLHQIAEPGCTRSHPHEAMSPECRIRAVIAEMRNREARGAEATEHCLGRFADVLERALADRAMQAQAAPAAVAHKERAMAEAFIECEMDAQEVRRIVMQSGVDWPMDESRESRLFRFKARRIVAESFRQGVESGQKLNAVVAAIGEQIP